MVKSPTADIFAEELIEEHGAEFEALSEYDLAIAVRDYLKVDHPTISKSAIQAVYDRVWLKYFGDDKK
jgi:hypothetical protein